jgi:hypothetical protein
MNRRVVKGTEIIIFRAYQKQVLLKHLPQKSGRFGACVPLLF